mgnify:CR=1 FL=1
MVARCESFAVGQRLDIALGQRTVTAVQRVANSTHLVQARIAAPWARTMCTTVRTAFALNRSCAVVETVHILMRTLLDYLATFPSSAILQKRRTDDSRHALHRAIRKALRGLLRK